MSRRVLRCSLGVCVLVVAVTAPVSAEQPASTPSELASAPAASVDAGPPSISSTQAAALTTASGSEADTIVIEVGTVRVAATRPNGNKWDTIVEGRKADPCDIAELIPQWGKALSTICKLGSEEGSKRITHDGTAPDIFVRIQTGGRLNTVYRTYTARNLYAHDFRSRFVIPLAAIPATGLQVQVVDDDGDASAEEEIIGEIRVSRARALQTLQLPEPIITDKDGSVEKITLAISRDLPTDDSRQIDMNARNGVTAVQGLMVDAGQVVEICATGRYQVQSGDWIDARGIADKPDRVAPREPFSSANYGSAIALIGHARMVNAVVAAPCAHVVVGSSGEVVAGINDRDPSDNDGVVHFLIRVTDPSPDEWRTRTSNRSPMALPAIELTPALSPTLWLDRAEVAARALFEGSDPQISDQIQGLARRITEIMHPSGGGTAFDGATVSRHDDQIDVDMNVSWTGAFFRHHTLVRWVFNRNQHISASVVSDTALVGVAGPNAQRLDEEFRSAYRTLRAKLGE